MANGAPTVSNGLVISGVTTSTTFSGSGASLTNLNGSNIASGTVPVARIGTGTKNSSTFYRGDGTFQVVNTDLVSDTSPQLGGDLSSNSHDILFADNDKAIFGTGSDFKIYHNGTNNYLMASNGDYVFDTGSAELVRIDSSGRVLIGTTTAGNSDADDLTIANSAHAGITLRSGTSSQGAIYFSDATSGAAQYDGFLGYNQSDRAMFFGTAQATRVRIDSAGRLLVGTSTEGFATYGDKFTIANSGHCGMTIRSGTSSYGTIYFSDGDAGGAEEVRGFIDYNHSTNQLQLGSNAAARLRIDSNGYVTMPNQPAFRAYISGGPQGINGTIPFSQIDYNIGSNYNSSNYRFTAPVAGRYAFHFYSIFRGNHTNNAFGFYINGGGFSGDRAHFTKSIGNNWDYIDMSQVLNLGSGDYVTCLTHSSVDLHGGNWAAFSGHLVG